jgi:hypothetical protein
MLFRRGGVFGLFFAYSFILLEGKYVFISSFFLSQQTRLTPGPPPPGFTGAGLTVWGMYSTFSIALLLQ